ncbi:hypothetical protein ACFE04_000414 [Oxalis oulophora]
MTVSPQLFPQRKRRASAGSFITPKLSDVNLLESVLVLSQEISSLKPLEFLLKRNVSSLIRKSKLLAVLFEELILLSHNNNNNNNNNKTALFTSSTLLCYEEMHIVLLRMKMLIEDCDRGSKMWLLMQIESVANAFHELTVDLSTLLDIFPLKDLGLCLDVEELVALIRKHSKVVVMDPRDQNLKRSVLDFVDRIKNEIVPDHDNLKHVFLDLGLRDSLSCTEEMESLEEEIQNQNDEKSKSEIAAFMGLVRYAKCVLYGSYPDIYQRNKSVSEMNISFQANDKLNPNNKAAFQATKMTASFLVNKLSASSSHSLDAVNGFIYELRVLAKTDSDSRSCIAQAGAIPLLVRYLGQDTGSAYPNLQVNAITTILNLSILESNKTMIIETDGALNGVIEVLRSGSTWEAKGNAAATIFSLSGLQSYRKRLGRKTRVIKGLLDLIKEGPTAASKRDALIAILNLAADRETVGRLVDAGVIEIIRSERVIDMLPDEAVTVLEVVVKRGGLVAVAAAFSALKRLGVVLREGSDTSRESAAATLVTICRKGGLEVVAELAGIPGIERVLWELMGTGTSRGRRKAATLLRILRRWAAGLEPHMNAYSITATATATGTNIGSSTIMLPS